MDTSRRALLTGMAATAAVGRKACANTQAVEVGAIRWDAWYSKTGQSVFPQNNLSSQMYRGRAPIHCTVSGDTISCTGDQAVLDAEIEAAHRGGVAFWAFDWDPGELSFRRAWDLYQSSSLNRLVKWCPIAGLGYLGSASGSIAEMDGKAEEWIRLFASPTFHRVVVRSAQRPLFFIFYRPDEMHSYFKTFDQLFACLTRIKKKALDAGVGEPYFVLFNPALDKNLFANSGADASSNYIGRFRHEKRGSFLELDRQVRQYWDRMAATGEEIIPIAQVGWDTRPRHDHPVPWEKSNNPADHDLYYAIATPDEFAAHMMAAIGFVKNNPTCCAANTVLLYSWSECDEGGCVMPTLGDPGGEYLAALARVRSDQR